jgi:hypothetical protein
VAYRDDREALHAQVEALESELREERARRGKLEQELEQERQQQQQEQPEPAPPPQQPPREKKAPGQAAPARARKRKRKPKAHRKPTPTDGLLARLPYRGTLIASLISGSLAVLLGVVAALEWTGGSRLWMADAGAAAGYAIVLLLALLKPWSWASGGIAAFVVGISFMVADLSLASSGWRAFLGIAGAIPVLPLLSWDDR